MTGGQLLIFILHRSRQQGPWYMHRPFS